VLHLADQLGLQLSTHERQLRKLALPPRRRRAGGGDVAREVVHSVEEELRDWEYGIGGYAMEERENGEGGVEAAFLSTMVFFAPALVRRGGLVGSVVPVCSVDLGGSGPRRGTVVLEGVSFCDPTICAQGPAERRCELLHLELHLPSLRRALWADLPLVLGADAFAAGRCAPPRHFARQLWVGSLRAP
jgi:hypothetical protein